MRFLFADHSASIWKEHEYRRHGQNGRLHNAEDSREECGEKKEGWVWPTFEERSFEAFRAYYEYVPKGRWVVEYTLRLNQTGTFQLPTTRVEALYFPEMLGENLNADIEVRP